MNDFQLNNKGAISNIWIGLDVKSVIENIRVHHQLYPEELFVEPGFSSVRQNFFYYLNAFFSAMKYNVLEIKSDS